MLTESDYYRIKITDIGQICYYRNENAPSIVKDGQVETLIGTLSKQSFSRPGDGSFKSGKWRFNTGRTQPVYNVQTLESSVVEMVFSVLGRMLVSTIGRLRRYSKNNDPSRYCCPFLGRIDLLGLGFSSKLSS